MSCIALQLRNGQFDKLHNLLDVSGHRKTHFDPSRIGRASGVVNRTRWVLKTEFTNHRFGQPQIQLTVMVKMRKLFAQVKQCRTACNRRTPIQTTEAEALRPRARPRWRWLWAVRAKSSP
jgi:hypothetical protein